MLSNKGNTDVRQRSLLCLATKATLMSDRGHFMLSNKGNTDVRERSLLCVATKAALMSDRGHFYA